MNKKQIQSKLKQLKKKQKKCDHEFKSKKGWENFYHLAGMGETLEKYIFCRHCNLKAREIWTYSCILDENNNQI